MVNPPAPTLNTTLLCSPPNTTSTPSPSSSRANLTNSSTTLAFTNTFASFFLPATATPRIKLNLYPSVATTSIFPCFTLINNADNTGLVSSLDAANDTSFITFSKSATATRHASPPAILGNSGNSAASIPVIFAFRPEATSSNTPPLTESFTFPAGKNPTYSCISLAGTTTPPSFSTFAPTFISTPVSMLVADSDNLPPSVLIKIIPNTGRLGLDTTNRDTADTPFSKFSCKISTSITCSYY